MQVLSPVGRFRVSADGLRIRNGQLVVKASLGAWRSEVTLERADLPLLSAVVGVGGGLLAAAFGAGRWSAGKSRGAGK
ncbi:hypothetical protein [Mycolicibacterium sp.]|uniref:hypothetical protein n=1 Tax=Mycolicibacterium sp. TaxID=2320850 RepID=UPI003D0B63C1